MLKNHIAYFVVAYYNTDAEECTEAGFYPADNFSEAMSYIEEFYGSDLAEVQHLELLDTSMLPVNTELAKQIIAEFYG